MSLDSTLSRREFLGALGLSAISYACGNSSTSSSSKRSSNEWGYNLRGTEGILERKAIEENKKHKREGRGASFVRHFGGRHALTIREYIHVDILDKGVPSGNYNRVGLVYAFAEDVCEVKKASYERINQMFPDRYLFTFYLGESESGKWELVETKRINQNDLPDDSEEELIYTKLVFRNPPKN